MTDTTTPAVWVDGDPLMEAIAAAVWEQCRTDYPSSVVDDPRNIAAVAATVARAHAASAVVVPAADRAAPELTAEEARTLAEDLGYQLYRAQDALAFVGECCDIADRERRPVTTADVREWLKGARCGRQLVAEAADRAALRDRIADVLADADGWRWVDDRDKARSSTYRSYQSRADAVLSVLPAPADRAAEEHRLALSDALGLGTGAPWDAIHDRATELGLPPLDQDPVARRLGLVAEHRAAVLREAADAIDAETRQAKADQVLEPDKYRPCRDASAQLRRMAVVPVVGVAADTPPAETCTHCGKPVRLIRGTLAAWWVHVPGGNTICFPQEAATSPRAEPGPVAPAQPGNDTKTPKEA